MKSNDWEQMPYFLTVARAGSFRAAAEVLGVTHGTVSRHIAALETSYGAVLFQRSKSGPILTKAGRRLLPLAEEAEILFNRARRNMRGSDLEESGPVRFTLSGALAYEIVAPILGRFSAHYPDIDLQIVVSDRLEDINRLQADVSLRYARSISDDVVARKLVTMNLGVYASREYVEQNVPAAGPQGEGLHWIGWDQIDRDPDWLADTPFPKAEVRHACIDHVMQLSLVRSGVGMLRTTPYFARLYPELIRVPDTVVKPDTALWLLLHADLQQTARVRRLVDFLAVELKKMRSLL